MDKGTFPLGRASKETQHVNERTNLSRELLVHGDPSWFMNIQPVTCVFAKLKLAILGSDIIDYFFDKVITCNASSMKMTMFTSQKPKVWVLLDPRRTAMAVTGVGVR